MRLNLGSGLRRNLIGYTNLTKERGWLWESGLDYGTDSVECVTSSHTLMYVPIDFWASIHQEVYRVLKPGGIWRITEDETDDEKSIKFGGHQGYITRTSPARSRVFLEDAGFTVYDCRVDETHFTDRTILQNNYGGLTTPYWIEGIKPG